MTVPNDGGIYTELSIKKPNQTNAVRRISAQVIATVVTNLQVVVLGMIAGFPTILIPALTGNLNKQNHDEFLTMTGSETSWIGSMGYFVSIFGSLTSGFLIDRLGRKRSMILMNVPLTIGWLMLYQATEIRKIFIAFAMLGFSTGALENSVFSYLGEICEPSTRGVLNAFSTITFSLGMFIVYMLNAWMPWRSVASICLVIPITSAITLCFIPETPQWLLSKHRTNQAQKSLCWLRGWTTEQKVAHEFYELHRHNDRSNSCSACVKQDQHCLHPPATLLQKLGEFKRKSALKPFFIIISLFFITQFTGMWSMRPFIVNIFKAYNSPISSDETVLYLSLSDNIANVIFICLLRFTGKRRIFLTMTIGIFLSSFIISCYGFIYLPSGFNSFNQSNQTFHLEDSNLGYIPTVCLYLWNFCTVGSFSAMPWILLAEILPLKVRVLASGFLASMNYVMGFIGKKTYYNLETTLSLSGVSSLYCGIASVGLILMYLIFPETEDRTLEDIELHFSDNSKKLTDRKIARSQTDPNEVPANQQLLTDTKKIQIVANDK